MTYRDRDRRRPSRPSGPPLPDDVAASDLDTEVRRDLITLDKATADAVARHLVMVTRLLDDDPATALAHARAARDLALRVGVVREAAGIAAYHAGEWQEAIGELRAARRITGNTALLPLIADAERGLGRPERAIEIARGDEGRALTGPEATEMRIVEAGARLDLGEPEKALITLQREDLRPGQTGTTPARVFYAYASALAAAGRIDEARIWFMNAASADVDDATDAEFRLMELSEDLSGSLATPEAGPEAETTTAEPAVAEVPSAEPAVADAVPTEPHTELPGEPPIETLADRYDALLLDLDGTVFAGTSPCPGALEALGASSTRRVFVTNNASRRPAEVAAHLQELGFTATADEVVTSAQTGARLLAEHLHPGARALVLGTDGLVQEVREVGIAATRSAADRPLAVIQGFSPQTSWEQLSEAALAIRAGALWIATNIDATLPSERGLLVGNGSLVAAVANATGAQPIVAGKPAAPLMADAIARSGGRAPLVVGDRLDTDIQGANAVNLDSLLVLTGVSTAADVLAAITEQRPTYVAADLVALTRPVAELMIAEKEQWQITADNQRVSIRPVGDAAADTLLPALAATVWRLAEAGAVDPRTLTVSSDDPSTQKVLDTLGLRA
ncbi:MAG: HAD-IIA family hydrolase [Gordonia sp. (in: high G+C Gram-positive bacteria)]